MLNNKCNIGHPHFYRESYTASFFSYNLYQSRTKLFVSTKHVFTIERFDACSDRLAMHLVFSNVLSPHPPPPTFSCCFLSYPWPYLKQMVLLEYLRPQFGIALRNYSSPSSSLPPSFLRILTSLPPPFTYSITAKRRVVLHV